MGRADQLPGVLRDVCLRTHNGVVESSPLTTPKVFELKVFDTADERFVETYP